MPAKKHTFDIGTLSSAIDKITMQGSKVFINFSGNEKNYEYLPQKDANELEGEPFNIWSYILIGMVVLFGVFILFSKKK